MKAIILAAGNARRLLPQTAEIPKTLLRVGSQTIFEHILDALREAGIYDVIVVTGHGKHHLESHVVRYCERHPDMHIETRENPEYERAGNIVSLHVVADILSQDDVVIINSDTIFHSSILRDLVQHTHPHAFAIDNVKTLGDEEMKVLVNADGAITRIHKNINPSEAFGEYIGVMKIGKEAAESIAHALAETIERNNSLYYEDGLQHAISTRGIIFTSVTTDGRPAMEIDTQQDLDAAQELITDIYVNHRS